jgi:hypothetical protein
MIPQLYEAKSEQAFFTSIEINTNKIALTIYLSDNEPPLKENNV